LPFLRSQEGSTRSARPIRKHLPLLLPSLIGCTVGREWLTFTLNLRLRVTHHLAKPVQKRESRVCTLHPLASALYVHSADPRNFGATAFGILRSGTGSSDGFVVSADSGFQTLMMFRELLARLKDFRELIRSH
jgi:hypothetical protein